MVTNNRLIPYTSFIYGFVYAKVRSSPIFRMKKGHPNGCPFFMQEGDLNPDVLCTSVQGLLAAKRHRRSVRWEKIKQPTKDHLPEHKKLYTMRM